MNIDACGKCTPQSPCREHSADGHSVSSFGDPSLRLGGHYLHELKSADTEGTNVLTLYCSHCGDQVPCGGLFDYMDDAQVRAARMWVYGYYLARDCE